MRRDESPWYAAGFTLEWWISIGPEGQIEFLDSLSLEELDSFYRDWRVWANHYQIPPEHPAWDTWLFLAGRGSGKTRSAVEYIKDCVDAGWARRIAIVGQGEDDVRQVMVEGESGFLECSSPFNMPEFKPSVGGGQLIWPNGCTAFIYSAADTEALRGPQFHLGWFDEPMAVPRAMRQRALDNLEFCLRLGAHPQLILTTTPKKDPWLKEMKKKAKDPANCIHLSEATTHDNARNLAANFLRKIERTYRGSKIGLQEIDGKLLDDDENAMWTQETIDKNRLVDLDPYDLAEECDRVIVSVDPNTKDNNKTAHEAGIVVCAKRGRERFVLADRSIAGGPSKWGKAAVDAAREFDADEICAEGNQGGDMVKIVVNQAMADGDFSVKVHVSWSKKSKVRRAEPVATLYDRGFVHHVGPMDGFNELELQLLYLHEGDDPTGGDFDRLDAMVQGLTRLGVKSSGKKQAKGSSGGFSTFQDILGGSTSGSANDSSSDWQN